MTNPIYDPFAVLQRVYGGGAFLKQALADTPIEELNRASTVKICYGVLENDLYLDHCIHTFAPKNPKLPIRIILKVSLYMLIFMNKQRYMVTDNAVALAKKLGKSGASGFINAFLRAFDVDKLKFPKDRIPNFSLRYSYPQYAVWRIVKEYKDDAERILQHSQPLTFVRFKDAKTAQTYLQKTEIQAVETPFETVYGFLRFRRDEGYDRGDYTFQSVGSAAICSVVEPCENLLDACAAPGGKSVLLSEKCTHVTSFELHEHRVKLIESYAQRMGAELTAVCRDSSVYDAAYEQKFDAVLADVPCSGYGVVNDNPDIKLFRKEEDIAQICAAQDAILNACCNYVKPNGFLYYSTCSLFGEENDGTVSRFLQSHPQFSAEAIESPLGNLRKRYGLQFLPHLSMGVGFYVSKLKRNAE